LDLLEHIQLQLRVLDADGLLRTPKTVQGRQGPDFVLDGRRVLCLCSNNYLGLADHPAIAAAAMEGTGNYSFGACSARHVTGTSEAHVAAERAVARYLRQPRALFFSTGYAANLGTIQAMSTRDTLVLSDAMNHASLIDGCRLGRGTTLIYRHCDVAHVEELLRVHRQRFAAAIVVTESLFSMDGDQAPLQALRTVCDQYNAALVVDEAHALGVFGPGGRGLCAQLELAADLVTGTFGKAFGASGAFVAGPAPLVQWIENRARAYVFSTAPSPAVPSAVTAALELVVAGDAQRQRLLQHARTLRERLRSLGYDVAHGDSHIIPVLLGSPSAAVDLSRRLFDRGVFVHAIRPPTVPPGTSRLRVTPMATHDSGHIEAALDVFAELSLGLPGAP
jgi:8-amino-7-oxononanoate synthase